MSDSLRSHGLYGPWNSPGQNNGVGHLSLLQGIFPAQAGLQHCRQILHQLSHKGSPNNTVKEKVKVKSLSPAQLFATPWTVAYQAPRSMGFSRQEYWSGLPLHLTKSLLSSVVSSGLGISCSLGTQSPLRGNTSG